MIGRPDPTRCLLKQIALEHGASVAGIADLTQFVVSPDTPVTAIVFGVRYSEEAVEALPAENVWEPMAQSLSGKALELYSRLADGLRSFFPCARACRIDQAQEVLGVKFEGLSQKAIAVLAGMGWIGKSSLLVNPAWGPRIRLGTLLTNAPIPPDAPFYGNNCGDCRVCMDACPVQAITNTRSVVKGFTTFSIDVQLCLNHICRHVAQTGRRHYCGLCLKVCPFGTKGGRQAHAADAQARAADASPVSCTGKKAVMHDWKADPTHLLSFFGFGLTMASQRRVLQTTYGRITSTASP
jgi:epoxyqueuosine reductase QueG